MVIIFFCGKKTIYSGVLLVKDIKIAESLRPHIVVLIHENFYPKRGNDGKTIYSRLNLRQKIEVDRLLEIFSKVSGIKMPNYTSNGDYGIYQFEFPRLVPTVLGMLKNYPSLDGAVLRYDTN